MTGQKFVTLSTAFITFAIIAASDGASVAQDMQGGPALKDLTDDASRAQLFQKITAEAVEELKRSSKGHIGGGSYVPDDFGFPDDTKVDRKLGIARKDAFFGIDISHYTDRSLNFKKLKDQNVYFAYAKATQGTGYKDPKFAYFWSALKEVNGDVRKGAYHFLSSCVDGAAQAKTFVDFVNSNGGFGKSDMPPVVDLEWDITSSGGEDHWRNCDADPVQTTLDWLKYVEKATGRTPVVYTARSWWRERHIPDSRFAEFKPYRIWIADYSRSGRAVEKPGVPGNAGWHIWQFTDHSKLSDGYGGTLDANVFKGTKAAFESFASK